MDTASGRERVGFMTRVVRGEEGVAAVRYALAGLTAALTREGRGPESRIDWAHETPELCRRALGGGRWQRDPVAARGDRRSRRARFVRGHRLQRHARLCAQCRGAGV